MSQIIKAFLGVFLTLFMTGSAISVLAGYLIVLDAQNVHAALLDEAENSDFAPAVLQDCFTECSRHHYKLYMTLYYENGGVVNADNASGVPADTSEVAMAKLALAFPYRITFFNIQQEHTLTGFARGGTLMM